jgi:hypothetical protein
VELDDPKAKPLHSAAKKHLLLHPKGNSLFSEKKSLGIAFKHIGDQKVNNQKIRRIN